GRRLAAPVLYPGSIERTSVAEIGETKGFMVVDVCADGVRWEFRRLPARPMIRTELAATTGNAGALESALAAIIARAPRDAVISIRITGSLEYAHWQALSPARLRALVPDTMNVEIMPADRFEPRRFVPHATATFSGTQLELL